MADENEELLSCGSS